MGADPSGLAETLLASSPDAAIVVGPGGKIEMAGPQVEALFGYMPEELIGEPVEKLIPEDLREAHVAHRASFAEGPIARSMGSGLELFGRRKAGDTVPIDVSLAPISVGDSRLVCAFVRDATERRRREDLHRFVNEIAQVVLEVPDNVVPDNMETLVSTCRRALLLAEADISWIAVPRGDTLVVAAADGFGSDHLLGAEIALESSISGRAITSSEPIIIDDMSSDPEVLAEARDLALGSGIYLPMVSEAGPYGALVVARQRGSTSFTRSDAQILGVFASAASIVLTLGQARRELERLQFVAERDRIARDLHDNVIQRLFAVGLSLQGVQRLAEGIVEERISGAIEAVDDAIKEIRETIFELGRHATEGARTELKRLVTDASAKFGLQPLIRFYGPVDSVVDSELTAHMTAVAREALSNAARHGGARSVEVTVDVSNGTIRLVVSDDGKGFPDNLYQGHGLANMHARADMLGGSLRISSQHGSGGMIEWQVPAPPR